MPDHTQTVGWIALWPLPFALGALLCAAYGWPRGDNAISAGAAALTFSLLYAVIMVIGRLAQHSFTPRAMFIATVIGVVYHLVAFSLPRSEGFVQLGFGDLMIAGGALVYMRVGKLAAPLRRSALERPARLERALTTDDSAHFRVISAAEDADGWVLFGRLQGPHGTHVWQVVRLRSPMAIASARGLGTPIKIIASASRLYVFAEEELSGSRVAIALPQRCSSPHRSGLDDRRHQGRRRPHRSHPSTYPSRPTGWYRSARRRVDTQRHAVGSRSPRKCRREGETQPEDYADDVRGRQSAPVSTRASTRGAVTEVDYPTLLNMPSPRLRSAVRQFCSEVHRFADEGDVNVSQRHEVRA